MVYLAAYNGHLEMLQELLERFNCEADKKDKKVSLHLEVQMSTPTTVMTSMLGVL